MATVHRCAAPRGSIGGGYTPASAGDAGRGHTATGIVAHIASAPLPDDLLWRSAGRPVPGTLPGAQAPPSRAGVGRGPGLKNFVLVWLALADEHLHHLQGLLGDLQPERSRQPQPKPVINLGSMAVCPTSS